MTSLRDAPPLNQPEHRLGILSMLPEEAIVATARAASRDQDMAWLDPMVRGGLLDADEIQTSNGPSAVKRAAEWNERAHAFTAFLGNVVAEDLTHDAVLGTLSPPIPVLAYRPSDTARALFGDAIERTVPILKRLEASHPDWESMELSVHLGMASLLHGAIAMDLPDAVKTLVRDFPNTVGVEIPTIEFGKDFAAGVQSFSGQVTTSPKAEVNAFAVALRLSREKCLGVLLVAHPNGMKCLGRIALGHGTSLSLTNLGNFIPHGCSPSVWAGLQRREYVDRAFWKKPSKDNYIVDRDDFLQEFEPASRLGAELNATTQLYLAAMVKKGVFDAYAEYLLPAAVENGHPELVARLVDRVSDWAIVEEAFLGSDSPIVQVAKSDVSEQDSVQRKNEEAAVLAFLKGSLAHGRNAVFAHRPEIDFPHASSMEPFCSVAEAGFNRVVVLYLDQGFDVHQTCPPDEDGNEPLTVIEQLTQTCPAAAMLIRSYLARHKARDLLDEIGSSAFVVLAP